MLHSHGLLPFSLELKLLKKARVFVREYILIVDRVFASMVGESVFKSIVLHSGGLLPFFFIADAAEKS